MSKTASALTISHLTKKYDKQHGISDISLEVGRGEVFGFLGPNGAGKSTTINTVLDLLRPDSGEITIFGVSHLQAKRVHRQTGYLSGDMATDPSMTGRQYLKFISRIHGSVDPARIAHLEKRLRADTSTKIKHLSRGNKQKIGLIASLMHDPNLLILDEPTSGLDPLMQAEFNLIIREHAERGKSAFISSHALDEVESICDRVGFIRGGELIQSGSLAEMRGKSGLRVSADFKKRPTTAVLQKLKRISHLTADDSQVSFLYHGDINLLLDFFVKHPVKSLEMSEPDLESLFMRYYEEGSK